MYYEKKLLICLLTIFGLCAPAFSKDYTETMIKVADWADTLASKAETCIPEMGNIIIPKECLDLLNNKKHISAMNGVKDLITTGEYQLWLNDHLIQHHVTKKATNRLTTAFEKMNAKQGKGQNLQNATSMDEHHVSSSAGNMDKRIEIDYQKKTEPIIQNRQTIQNPSLSLIPATPKVSTAISSDRTYKWSGWSEPINGLQIRIAAPEKQSFYNISGLYYFIVCEVKNVSSNPIHITRRGRIYIEGPELEPVKTGRNGNWEKYGIPRLVLQPEQSVRWEQESVYAENTDKATQLFVQLDDSQLKSPSLYCKVDFTKGNDSKEEITTIRPLLHAQFPKELKIISKSDSTVPLFYTDKRAPRFIKFNDKFYLAWRIKVPSGDSIFRFGTLDNQQALTRFRYFHDDQNDQSVKMNVNWKASKVIVLREDIERIGLTGDTLSIMDLHFSSSSSKETDYWLLLQSTTDIDLQYVYTAQFLDPDAKPISEFFKAYFGPKIAIWGEK